MKRNSATGTWFIFHYTPVIHPFFYGKVESRFDSSKAILVSIKCFMFISFIWLEQRLYRARVSVQISEIFV